MFGTIHNLTGCRSLAAAEQAQKNINAQETSKQTKREEGIYIPTRKQAINDNLKRQFR